MTITTIVQGEPGVVKVHKEDVQRIEKTWSPREHKYNYYVVIGRGTSYSSQYQIPQPVYARLSKLFDKK